MNYLLCFCWILPAFFLVSVLPGWGQPIPSETATRRLLSLEQSIISQNSSSSVNINVKSIEVIGSTIFNQADFVPIIQPLVGKTVSLETLQQVADSITQLYLNAGYLTSRAVIEENSLETGNIKFLMVEGSVETIEIQGGERLANYVRSRLELATAPPLNTNRLEDQLRLLRIDPLIANIEASLRAGTSLGQSILVVRVTEADAITGNISLDNYSPPSIGATRLNLDLLYRNLSGIGDTVSISYRPRLEAFTGTYRVELNYSAPINPQDGTISLRGLYESNEVIEGLFEPFDISGESQRYTFTYRQPLIRTFIEELALSIGFEYYAGQTFTFQGPTPFGFGPAPNGVSRTSVLILSQDYTLREASGAWAFRSQFRIGTCTLNATCNSSPIPSGDFFSWLGQIQRLQVLNEDNLLIVQLDLQLTPDSLLPSEQFAIGGGQSVRGYRQNILAGDNGIRFSVEDRITLVRNDAEDPVFILAPFLDLGAIWNAGGNPNMILADSGAIVGLGLGIIWQPIDGLSLRLDYAPPLVDLNTRGNNVQDDGFYFSVGYRF